VYPGEELIAKNQQPNFSDETKPKRLGVLSPGSERTYENIIPMRDLSPELTKVAIDYLRTQTLSIHGTITYDDIFGCHHWVTYNAFLSDDWREYSFSPDHNDTDHEYEPCRKF
jgi:hypothetical protein